MPTTLLTANIRGIRSYSPDKSQSIDFMPLTLILGANGTGKTSIIEALKFIIAGEEPPHSDSRRNFIHIPKVSSDAICRQKSSYASIELSFLNSCNEQCVAKREISQPSLTKATPSIWSGYRIGQRAWQHINKQEDWCKTLPRMFDLQNQAILNNVILCHQENNLWCMEESSAVKLVFDRIFGCEQYKREVKYLEMEIKTTKNELSILERDLLRCKERVELKNRVTLRAETLKTQMQEAEYKIQVIDQEIETANTVKKSISESISAVESKSKDIDSLKYKIESLQEQEKQYSKRLKGPSCDLIKLSVEDIEAKVEKCQTDLTETRTTAAKIRMEDAELKVAKHNLETKKDKLQQEADNFRVQEIRIAEYNKRLQNDYRKLKAEYEVSDSVEDINEETMKMLQDFESKLIEQKSDLVQKDDDLSRELRSLSKESSNLDGNFMGLTHKLKMKEAMVLKLKHQIAEADPVAKDLNQIVDNFVTMNQCIELLDKNLEPVKKLQGILKETQNLLVGVTQSMGKDNVTRLKNELDKENIIIQECTNNLEMMSKQKAKLRSEIENIEQEQFKTKTSLKDAQNKMLHFKSTRADLEHLYGSLIVAKKSVLSDCVQTSKDKLKDCSEAIEQMRRQLNDISSQRANLDEKVSRIYEQQEECRNALQARKLCQQIMEAKEKIELLQQEVKDVDKLQQFKLELKEVDKKIWELREKKSMLVGSKGQMHVEWSRLACDVSSLSDVHHQYSSCLGRMICNRIILSDLQKLKDCFNHSIISFHERMMAKINEVLKIRWRQIYQGSDIDSIELVDEEVIRGKEKRYNHFIAMRKGAVRMKMREQSSAGQKALASIIVRMTLAELFVKDFAFMALDEPTANLDHANVESLAKIVGQHVRRRAKNGVNIQWIIITHDEHFIKALDAECSPFYYKVDLDSKGHSQIRKIALESA